MLHFRATPIDLYGLGIRLGVYLQWVSSWLSNSLNPIGATLNHDANSIFVLAIACALISVAVSGEVHPVEGYIMLLICYGYFLTVLTIFGLRLRLLDRVLIQPLYQQVKSVFESHDDQYLKTLQSLWENRKNVLTYLAHIYGASHHGIKEGNMCRYLPL